MFDAPLYLPRVKHLVFKDAGAAGVCAKREQLGMSTVTRKRHGCAALRDFVRLARRHGKGAG